MNEHVEEYHAPTSLREVQRLLRKHGERAAVVAGGSVQPLRLPSRVRVLVDIMRCGLEGISAYKDGVRIGATTTAGTLAAAAELDPCGGEVLRQAAASISAQAVRNQVTVGGNLVGTMYWADLSVALVALGARVEIATATGGKRALAIDELLAENPRKVLKPAELVTAVTLSPTGSETGGTFIKFVRTVADVALVSVAARVRMEQGRCRDVRIVVGATQPRPVLLKKAATLLEGQPLTDELARRAGELAGASVSVQADMRATKEYRRRVVAVMVTRAIQQAAARATGADPYAPPRRPRPPAWPRHEAHAELGHTLRVTIDGEHRALPIRPTDNLLEVLRRAGVMSVKRGCNDGYCGTCAIMADGRLLNACLLLAPQVDGCQITTAAGIGSIYEPHPIQTALVDSGAVQCGFCTPGMVVASTSLLAQLPDPTDEELCAAMDGNLCRCTGYIKPLAAIQKAARTMQNRPPE